MKKTRLKTSKRTFGYILVIIGIIIPLIAFLRMSVAQVKSKSSFEKFTRAQSEVSSQKLEQIDQAIGEYNSKVSAEAYESGQGSSIVDPFDTEDYDASYPTNLDKDAVFAYLRIPKMDLYKPIYLDATWEHMDMGVAQVDGTSLPIGGKGTKSVIAGHRGWWGDTMFLYLHVLEEGDSVFVERAGNTLEYRVDNFEVITPSQWERLLPEKGEDILTLQTCEPFAPPRPYRLLVNCKRVLPEVTENTENNQDVEDKIQVEEVNVEENTKSSEIKFANTLIYMVTLIGILGLIWVSIKFIVYLRK